jgi:enoyl-[acyl-carrier protein] reductase II
MAGQSVGMVTSIQSVAEIIAELVAQATTALALRGAAAAGRPAATARPATTV